MRMNPGHIKTLKASPAIVAASLFLVACGGSEPASSNAPASAPEAVAAVEDAAEAAVAETEAAAAEVQEEVQETATAQVEAVQDAVEEAAETAEAAAEEAAETAEAAVEEVSGAAADQAVSDGVAAEYAALTGDAAAGRRVFTRCMSCHVVAEGQNRAGPSLYRVIGRNAGTVENFRYSSANADSGIVWTEEALFEYLENPRAFVPGTIMAFPGLPKAQDRADVIAYIKSESE